VRVCASVLACVRLSVCLCLCLSVRERDSPVFTAQLFNTMCAYVCICVRMCASSGVRGCMSIDGYVFITHKHPHIVLKITAVRIGLPPSRTHTHTKYR